MSVKWRWFVKCLIDWAMMWGDRVILTVTGDLRSMEQGRGVRGDTSHTHHTPRALSGAEHEQTQDNYLHHQHADSDHSGWDQHRGSRVQWAITGPNNSGLTNSYVSKLNNIVCVSLYGRINNLIPISRYGVQNHIFTPSVSNIVFKQAFTNI